VVDRTHGTNWRDLSVVVAITEQLPDSTWRQRAMGPTPLEVEPQGPPAPAWRLLLVDTPYSLQQKAVSRPRPDDGECQAEHARRVRRC
jgi:hypothetical protein